ncbi:Os10g0523300 [Oryza sativa Japonica Group]|uniref:Os10g0523300 protein n=1 Tax=Oryza sativa subsp. japonica TaxID=39947 RepID=A0A0P0XWG6_ORYSJ|nr:Os10g0523300 [Oryza sativa Japonica Group]
MEFYSDLLLGYAGSAPAFGKAVTIRSHPKVGDPVDWLLRGKSKPIKGRLAGADMIHIGLPELGSYRNRTLPEINIK